MPDLVMPQLSDSMEQGTILSWLKVSGDAVGLGDELLEIETDKSTVTYAAEAAGILETLVDEGATIPVGVPIARISSATTEPSDPSAEPTAAEPTAADPAPAEPGAPEPARNKSAGPVAELPERPDGSGQRTTATPLARRVAVVHGVGLDGIQGTGLLGRITRADVLARAGLTPAEVPVRPTAPTRAVGPAPTRPALGALPPLPPGSTRREPSRLQQLIARRMSEAKATVPHFQVQTDVRMDAAIALRAELTSVAGAGEPVPSINDLIIKSAALALREHPLANGSYQDDSFVLHDQINVGMAVAADEALVVPTIVGADTKSLGQIARETRALAGRVRDGAITPAELEGGTFTVSNLGMFGMTAINPVINPPQAAILGVGALRETLVRVEGEIVDSTLMTLTLSCDHRILYGADAARFLARIRELLEVPLRLAL